MNVRRARSGEWIAIGACACLVLLSGCGDDSGSPSADSQTHWLSACTGDAQCGGLRCICGVCVEPCSSDGSCQVPGRTTRCSGVDAPAPTALCGGAAPMPLCLEPCSADAACGGGRCLGACIPAADGAGGAGSGGMSGGDGDTTAGDGDATTGDGDATMGDGDATMGDGDGDGTVGGDGDAAGQCVPAGESCDPSVTGQCCDGVTCVEEGCTDAIPPSCFGTCGGSASAGLFWFSTCGDPVCGPPTAPPATGGCTTQIEGAPCNTEGDSCETGQCGASLLCTRSDPKAGPGGCPISRARFKRDIRYVAEAERRAYAQQLLSLPLATYRYRAAPDDREHLGFILEDVEPTSTAAVDGERDRVDLYGYTSLAVAAIQEQSLQIESLRREIERLREDVAELEQQCR